MIAVIAPIAATVVIASSDSAKTGKNRATRYTPAATIVAAWISAETGVGPSIASGSQTCSGNCADFPAAPANSPSANRVSAVDPTAPAIAASWISPMPSFPVCEKMIRIAIKNPRSPRRVTRNAFVAARRAESL